MSTLSIQVHLVFEMFLLKRWTAFMSTLSIQIENGFEAMIRVSSSIRNVLLKTEHVDTVDGIRNVSTQKMNCLHVNTVDTGWKESIWICQHCRYRFIWYSKCFYSKDELPSCRHCRYKLRMDLKQWYEFHPVFEMYYWRQSMSTLSIQGCLSRKSSILDERNPSEYVNTVDTRLFE